MQAPTPTSRLFDSTQVMIHCPSCGQYTHNKVVTFQRGRNANRISLSAIIAPFIKPPATRGQYCECCRHIFNIHRSRMPVLFYVWVTFLGAMLIALITILTLLLHPA